MPDPEKTQTEDAVAAALVGDPAPQQDQKQDWDRDRQRNDEVKALNRKVQETQQEAQELRDQLKELESQDGDTDTFEGLQKAFAKNQKLLAETQKQIQETQATLKRIDQLEGTVRDVSKTANTQAGEAALSRMCVPLDKQFGSQHRNAALMATEKKFVDLGINNLEPAARRKWVQEELHNAYRREVGDNQPNGAGNAQEVNPLVTDTSSGGTAQPNKGNQLNEGTLDEVADQYMKLHR